MLLRLTVGLTLACLSSSSAWAFNSSLSVRHLADQSCSIESGIDYTGNDIGSVLATAAENCCSLCAAKPGCGAFTWTNFQSGTCWLKSGKGATSSNSGARSAVLSSGASGSCSIQQGIDFIGNDIGNAVGKTAQDCCAACSSRSGCGAFSWTDFNGGTCWLKSAKGATVASANVFSAVVSSASTGACSAVEQNVDYSGNDIGSVTGSGAADCCSKCSARAGCGAFTWTNYHGGTCWLKSGKGTTKASVGAVSGVVSGAKAHIMPRLRSGEIPLRAVNLGGWLLPEYWMSYTSPAWKNADGRGWDGEYVTMQYLSSKIGRDQAIQQFEEHRQTWIKESDIAEIAAAGMNAVRVPVGFWIVNDESWTVANDITRVYAPGALKYLDKLINDWAIKYNLAVMLSLHAHQGSQNGYDHSAPQVKGVTSWSSKQENVDNSLQFATFLAARYKDAPAFLGMNLMNEPAWPTDYGVLFGYYKEAYRRIRATGNNCILGVSPWIQEQGPPTMMDFMRWPEYTNVWHEFHVYYKWGYEQKTEQEILDTARTYRASHLDNWYGNWVLMGEWSLASPDNYFKDVNKLKELAAIQLQQFNGAHSGWSFWSWRHDDETIKTSDGKEVLSGWSMRQLLRNNIFSVPRV